MKGVLRPSHKGRTVVVEGKGVIIDMATKTILG